MKKIFQMKEPPQKEAGAQDGKALHIRKNDWLLIAVLLVAAAGIYVAIQYYQKVSTQNAVAVVTVDGGIWEISTLGRSYRNHPL